MSQQKQSQRRKHGNNREEYFGNSTENKENINQYTIQEIINECDYLRNENNNLRQIIEKQKLEIEKLHQQLVNVNDNDNDNNHQHNHNQQLSPSRLLLNNSPYYLVNKTWTMGNRNLLRRLARVSHDNFHPYNRRTVNNLDDASKICKEAIFKLKDCQESERQKYFAAADAYSAIQYQGYDWNHKSIDFGQGKKSSHASVTRREFQLKTISKVIDICGENLPVNILPISIWSRPQRFAKKAIEYLEKVDTVSDDETDIPNLEGN